MNPRPMRPRTPRRGVTLVEMLVAVALLVLMMAVIVQVFTAATGAVSAARTYQELDSTLRSLEGTIRSDLTGVTARLTPPLDPAKNLGYFEYGENSFADRQLEDCDDYIRFTARAPEGQQFQGRFYAAPTNGLAWGTMTAAQQRNYVNSQPITITSDFAEIIYFLRNGNLYRRVLLVAPDRQSAANSTFALFGNSYYVGALGGLAATVVGAPSWQGVNDLSAHPIPTGGPSFVPAPFVLNTLGDLTNRENRFASPRFSNDFIDNKYNTAGQDLVPDDQNFDTVPDFYPSLYPNLFSGPYKNPITGYYLVNEPAFPSGSPRASLPASMLAFPFIFPGAYSRPDNSSYSLGWIHSPDPSLDLSTLAGLNALNHNPVDLGDSLPLPSAAQTWWGFPTWRETMSPKWLDPTAPIQISHTQPDGLVPVANASVVPPSTSANYAMTNVLPPMDNSYIPKSTTSYSPTTSTPFRLVPQYGAETYPPSGTTFNMGSDYFAAVSTKTGLSADFLWRQLWEDDVIATGVRSFDVKAYDDLFAGFVDLGWGDDMRVTTLGTTPFLVDNSSAYSGSLPLTIKYNAQIRRLIDQSYAHEGRIPPLSKDYRLDSRNTDETGFRATPDETLNVGDDTTSVVRLRRVWDSWSTDYSYAPATGVNPATATPIGPPYGRPVYPSYPAPYPMPLRGIQIQIRVVDPRNERLKVLTIRQDFSDKL